MCGEQCRIQTQDEGKIEQERDEWSEVNSLVASPV